MESEKDRRREIKEAERKLLERGRDRREGWRWRDRGGETESEIRDGETGERESAGMKNIELNRGRGGEEGTRLRDREREIEAG